MSFPLRRSIAVQDRGRSSGLSLVEVLMALSLVVVALLPLMQAGTEVDRSSHLSSRRVAGMVRARTLMGLAQNLDLLWLKAMSRREGGPVVVDLEAMFDPTDWSMMVSTPPPPGSKPVAYTDRILFVPVSDTLGRIEVTVSWTLPGHEDEKKATLTRLVHAPWITHQGGRG